MCAADGCNIFQTKKKKKTSQNASTQEMINCFDILAVAPPRRFTHFSTNVPSGQASPVFTAIRCDWLYSHRTFGVNQMAPETSSPRQLEDTGAHKQDMGGPTVVPSLIGRNRHRPAREYARAPLQETAGQSFPYHLLWVPANQDDSKE